VRGYLNLDRLASEHLSEGGVDRRRSHASRQHRERLRDTDADEDARGYACWQIEPWVVHLLFLRAQNVAVYLPAATREWSSNFQGHELHLDQHGDIRNRKRRREVASDTSKHG